MITKYSGMVHFFRDLVKCLDSMSIQRNHQALQLLSKIPVKSFTNRNIQKYNETLTPYALKHVVDQFKFAENTKLECMVGEGANFQTSAGIIFT